MLNMLFSDILYNDSIYIFSTNISENWGLKDKDESLVANDVK